VGLTLINPTASPIVMTAFVAPKIPHGPNPYDFHLQLFWTSDLHQDGMGFTHTSYSIHLMSLTHNYVNWDKHHHRPAVIHALLSHLVINTATSGYDSIDFLVPKLYYDRVSRSHFVTVKYEVTITDNIDHSFVVRPIWLVIVGPPNNKGVSGHHVAAGDLLHGHEAGAATSWHSNDDGGLSQVAVVYGGSNEVANSVSTIHHHSSIAAGDFVM